MSKGRHFTKNSFDIVAKNGNIFAKNGNNVEATFDFVERTIFYDKLVRHCCRFGQQSRKLLRQSRTLLRHCCWCERGSTVCISMRGFSNIRERCAVQVLSLAGARLFGRDNRCCAYCCKLTYDIFIITVAASPMLERPHSRSYRPVPL